MAVMNEEADAVIVVEPPAAWSLAAAWLLISAALLKLVQ